jgi:hypothetical protein
MYDSQHIRAVLEDMPKRSDLQIYKTDGCSINEYLRMQSADNPYGNDTNYFIGDDLYIQLRPK